MPATNLQLPPDPPAGVGFDLDHTLLVDNKLERVAMLHVLEAIGEAGGPAERSLDAQSAAIDALLARGRAAGTPIDDVVREFARGHGVRDAEPLVGLYRRRCLELVDALVIPEARVAEIVAALSDRGVSVAVLSNGWEPLQSAKARRAGFAGGPILTSGTLGVGKPEPAAFEALLTALGTAADRTWYVGDDPSGDIAGAQAAGLWAIWARAGADSYPAALPQPDAVLDAFGDLLELLPGASGAS
ncbi:MAG: HAD family hydrolase [Vulcanimicrobiaceae bacterium]